MRLPEQMARRGIKRWKKRLLVKRYNIEKWYLYEEGEDGEVRIEGQVDNWPYKRNKKRSFRLFVYFEMVTSGGASKKVREANCLK